MQWLIDILYAKMIADYRPKGTASFLVAASDAPDDLRLIADYTCDGTADQVQIQAAIDALPAEGGVVTLSPGTFLKNNLTPIDLVSNMKLLMSPSTVLQLTANPGNEPYILRANLKTNIIIEGGVIDGNKAAQTTITGNAFGIAFFNTRYSCIDKVTVKNIGTSDALSGYGIYLNLSRMNKITRCHLEAAKRENLVCFNDSENNIISNNIAILSEDRDYVLHSSNGCVFANNISNNAGGRGFEIQSDCEMNVITGNNIYLAATDGIANLGSKNQITNNSIEACSAHGINNTGDNSVIQGNYLKDNESGIYLGPTAQYNTVVSNYLENNGGIGGGEDNGVTIFGDDNFVTGNNFLKGTDQAYGIRIHAGGDNNLVSNNDLRNAGVTRNLREAGTGNIIRDNTGTEEAITAGVKTLITWDVNTLNSAGGAITGTLPDGCYIGQRKTVVMTNAANLSTVSVTHHETSDPEIGTFDAVDEVWILEWMGTEWVTIKATCTFL